MKRRWKSQILPGGAYLLKEEGGPIGQEGAGRRARAMREMTASWKRVLSGGGGVKKNKGGKPEEKSRTGRIDPFAFLPVGRKRGEVLTKKTQGVWCRRRG